jgi:hypothetical protein
MSTTTVLVEIIIIGVQTSIWLMLLLLTFTGYKWISWESLEKWNTVALALAVPVIYSLGAIFDMLNYVIAYKVIGRIFNKYIKPAPQFQSKLLVCLSEDSEMSKLIQERHNRLRVLVSTVVNCFMITVSASAFTLFQVNRPHLTLISSIVISGVLLTGLSLYAYVVLSNAFGDTVDAGYEIIKRKAP